VKPRQRTWSLTSAKLQKGFFPRKPPPPIGPPPLSPSKGPPPQETFPLSKPGGAGVVDIKAGNLVADLCKAAEGFFPQKAAPSPKGPPPFSPSKGSPPQETSPVLKPGGAGVDSIEFRRMLVAKGLDHFLAIRNRRKV